jgi:mannose-6-phosphate isomerase-like protein (cupin superfamily)
MEAIDPKGSDVLLIAITQGAIMKAIEGYFLITPEDLHWRPSNLMKIPNADYLERTGSENLGARLWRLPPKSANTLHKHIRAEEFYFVLEGVGRLRVGNQTLTVPKYGGVLVGPDQLRQVFNDTDAECSGSSWARRRKLNFCLAQKPNLICRSFTRLIRNNCQRNWQPWNGRQKVELRAAPRRTSACSPVWR